jgi:hypothetical protein
VLARRKYALLSLNTPTTKDSGVLFTEFSGVSFLKFTESYQRGVLLVQ